MKKTVCLQVIAYTVLDINRTTRLNQQPMSPEQTRALRELARQAQTKSGKLFLSLQCIFNQLAFFSALWLSSLLCMLTGPELCR